jgi:hypothetical protein
MTIDETIAALEQVTLITKRQRWMLECAASFLMGVYPNEVRTARALERKGLIRMIDDGPLDPGMVRYYAVATDAGRAALRGAR